MGKHRPYRKRVKLGVSICLLASGLIVGSAFMTWFESEGGSGFSVGDVQVRSASGWDLYGLRAPGEDGYAVDVSVTDPGDRSSEPISVPTGLASLISGLCLAASILFPLARPGSKGNLMKQARRRKWALRFLWVAYLVPLGLLGLAPSLGLAGAFLQARSAGGFSLGLGVILLWVATLAGTVGVLMSGSGIGQTESLIPDVRRAEWRHPYRLSGACPARASGLMLAAGIGGGLVVGFIGYWGGWLVFWVISHLQAWVEVVGGVWLEVQGESSSGNGARLALFVIAVMVIASVALAYPFLLGVASGSSVAGVAVKEKCRNTSATTAFGLLGGVATWGALAVTGFLARGAVHESSRALGLFDVVPGWLSWAVLSIDAALVILSAVYVVRKSMKESPFCERCQQWYGLTTETTVPVGTAMPLVSALASESAEGLTPVQTEIPAEIALRLQNCECRLADTVLSADVIWQKAKRNGKVSAKGKRVAWFQTTLPAELGAAVEQALFLAPSDATAALTIENATAGKDPGADADRRMSEVGR